MRIAFVTAVLLSAAAHAQLKVERVPADADPKTADVYKMSAHDVTLNEAVEAFSKQTGIDVALEESGEPNAGGPPVVYDVDFAGLGRVEAIKTLARTLSLGVIQNRGGPVRLSRNSWSGENNESRDTPGVIVSYINRTQSFPPSPQQPDSLSVQFRVFGGRRPISGGVRVSISDAVDDQGRTLSTPPARRGESFYESGTNQPSVEVSQQLALPTPLPKKLAKLSGTATINRAKTLLRITADKLTDAAMDGDLDGGTVTVGPLAPAKDDPNHWELPIAFTRGTMPNEKWNTIQRQFFEGVRTAEVRGPAGERMYLQSRGGSSGGDKMSMHTVVTRNPDFGEPANAKPLPKPMAFKWDVVVETAAEPIPFDLTDVPLP